MPDKHNKCPQCDFDNPPTMRFCGGCGAPLILEAEEEERKEVAVLFAEICDFTALVARSGPEEAKEKIDACLRLMADQIAGVGGVVEKFVGDAVMAVFGAPVAHENDAERAVRVGLSILDRVRRFGESSGMNIELRIGVHCGEAIVSAFEPTPGREHGVFGETVNLAARLKDSGEAGAVVASADVHARTKEFFEFEELSPVKVKGVAEPLARYRVVGAKAVRGKVRGLGGISAPMIGRDRELAALLDAYRYAARGEGGRVVAVIGDAGIGKTRLVEEARKALAYAGEEPAIFHGRCLGYAGARSYAPFTQMLTKAAGIKEDMPRPEMRGRLAAAVEATLGATKLGDIDAVATLEELLAFGGDGSRTAGRDTEQIREQIFRVVAEFLAAAATRAPAMVVVEDIHWADAATLALIKYLARALRASRCLLVLNSRPPAEYNAAAQKLMEGLEDDDGFLRIRLADLTPAESARLIQALLAVDRLSDASRNFIIARSGGNPFFVEEIIKTLIARGILVQAGESWTALREVTEEDVPDSIEGVLRARLDLLPRLEKKVLQRASVVGRVFWEKVVRELVEQSVAEFLGALERRDLIRQRLESMFEGDREYTFKHALLHETVYNGMLRRVRRDLHLRTAEWLVNNYGEHIDAYLSLVAHHFEMGGENETAATYYLKAGQQAAALYANDDAKKLFARAAACSSRPDTLRRAYLGRGDVCARVGANDEALTHFETARGYCATPVEEAEILYLTGDVYEKMSAYDKAMEYFQGAEEMLAGGPTTLIQCWVHVKKAWVHYLRGAWTESMEQARRAEAALEQFIHGDAEADIVRARTYSVIASVYREKDKNDEARKNYERALSLYERHGNLMGVASSLNNISILESNAGRYAAALASLHRSLELEEQVGRLFGQAVACCNLASYYTELGEYATARDFLERYLEINAEISNRLGDGYAYGGLARLAEVEGDYAGAEDYYRRSLAVYEEVGARSNALEIKRALAVFYALAGREAEFKALSGEARAGGADETELRVTEGYAALYTARRRPLSTREKGTLRASLADLEAAFMEDANLIGRMEGAAVLAELSAVVGDAANAERLHAQARAAAVELAENVGDGGLRTSFQRRLAALWPATFGLA